VFSRTLVSEDENTDVITSISLAEIATSSSTVNVFVFINVVSVAASDGGENCHPLPSHENSSHKPNLKSGCSIADITLVCISTISTSTNTSSTNILVSASTAAIEVPVV